MRTLSIRDFAILVIAAAMLVGLTLVVCALSYSAGTPLSFGLRPPLKEWAMACYASPFVISATSFYDIVLKQISEGKATPMQQGSGVLLVSVALAAATGIGGVLIASAPLELGNAKWVLGISASIWSFLVGKMYKPIFQAYADSKPPSTAESATAAPLQKAG